MKNKKNDKMNIVNNKRMKLIMELENGVFVEGETFNNHNISFDDLINKFVWIFDGAERCANPKIVGWYTCEK